MTELNATRNVKLWGGTTGDLLDTQLNCPAHGSDPNNNSEINSRLSSLRSIVAPFFPIQLFYLFESESTDSKMTTRELKMWGCSHCDKISFNGAVASSSLMLSLVISVIAYLVLSISSAREDDAAGETNTLARSFNHFK